MLKDILEYINDEDLNKLKDYKFINNITKINKGGHIRYINKKNYKFNNGGIIIDVKNDYNLLKIMNYNKNKTWHVYYDENYIFYKKKLSYREIMVNIMKGMNNKTVKITKLYN